MRCFRFDIVSDGMEIGVWGSDRSVHAVSLTKLVAFEMENKIARYFDVVETGNPGDPIAISFENYFRNGIFDPLLMPKPLWGTEFQRKVWDELSSLDRGETTTYGDLSKRIGKPGAARAVGGAVGANPIAILVPCHRVLAADGIGGFGGRIDIKRNLLQIEGIGYTKKETNNIEKQKILGGK